MIMLPAFAAIALTVASVVAIWISLALWTARQEQHVDK